MTDRNYSNSYVGLGSQSLPRATILSTSDPDLAALSINTETIHLSISGTPRQVLDLVDLIEQAARIYRTEHPAPIDPMSDFLAPNAFTPIRLKGD